MSAKEIRFRIYRVDQADTQGRTLRLVSSPYCYLLPGDDLQRAIEEAAELELASLASGEYVVYPFDACREFTVTHMVKRTK